MHIILLKFTSFVENKTRKHKVHRFVSQKINVYSGSTIQFSQISSEALSQLAYDLFKFIDGLCSCQLEKEPLKELANVQEIFSSFIS